MSTFLDPIIRHKEHNIANKIKYEHPILKIGEWPQINIAKSYRIFRTDNSPMKSFLGWAGLG